MTKSIFDFSDLTDLPEDLQKKLHTETSDSARVYADILVKAAEAGVSELDINQIIAVAHRMELDVPTQQTVRGYLNKAVELGLIEKPTRQTYAAPAAAGKGAKAEAVVADDAVVTAEVAEVDPLAAV